MFVFSIVFFNNKGITLTAKTVDEDIEKAGVASRNIVMRSALSLDKKSLNLDFPFWKFLRLRNSARDFLGLIFGLDNFFGIIGNRRDFFLVQLSLIQLIQLKRGYMCNRTIVR